MSRLKVLRSLEVAAWTTEFGLPDARDTVLMEVFSTITSSVFSDLIFVLWHDQFTRLLSDDTLFLTLRTMTEVRPFKLAFLLQVPHLPSREGRRKFEATLESVITEGLLDFLDSPPTICVVQPCPLVRPFP